MPPATELANLSPNHPSPAPAAPPLTGPGHDPVPLSPGGPATIPPAKPEADGGCPAGGFAELRRKLAGGEVLSRVVEKLAQALRFTGRITLTFHQGRLTKTILEESYIRGRSP